MSGSTVDKLTGGNSQAVVSAGNGTTPRKPFSRLTGEERKERLNQYLDVGFKCAIIPSAFVAGISSLMTFAKANFGGGEDEYWDRNANVANRVTYFCNGIYGALKNLFDNCLPGAIGYSLVSFSSFFPNAYMYFVKGPGSALDQIPAFLKDVASNDRIAKKYTKDGVNTFNNYSSLTDSVVKLKDAVSIVFQDIFKDYNKNRTGGMGVVGSLLKPLTNEFFSGKETGEKNLLISSAGILSGVIIGALSGMKGTLFSVGSSLRDLFGVHADLSLFKKGWSNTKEGVATGLGNLLYMVCGGAYTLGSTADLVYRWTGMNKLETLAVGMDNIGFLFMTWANAMDIDGDRKKLNGNNAEHTNPSGGNKPVVIAKPGTGIMPGLALNS